MQVLLTEDTQKERAAKLAALEEGEMLMESSLPSSSIPLTSLHQQQSRPAWPQKSPAMSTGACFPARLYKMNSLAAACTMSQQPGQMSEDAARSEAMDAGLQSLHYYLNLAKVITVVCILKPAHAICATDQQFRP